MQAPDTLDVYCKKRDFSVTPEPAGGGKANQHALTFVVQKHWARSLHYDFRLEFEGALKSWAIGISDSTRFQKSPVTSHDFFFVIFTPHTGIAQRAIIHYLRISSKCLKAAQETKFRSH